MLRGAKVVVVVPAYREARLLPRMLGGVPAFVDAIVVVDDASDDETSARALAAPDRRVVLARHARNRGVGAAIVTGYREALARGADVVAVMAGDDQMCPDDLEPLVLAVIEGRADYAKGERFSNPDVGRVMPRERYLAGRVLSAATRVACGMATLADSQCGFTAISAAALSRLDLDALWPRYGYPNDLLAQLGFAGMRVVDVPVRPVYADESSGVRPRHVLTIGWLLARALVRRATRRD